ncbi:hypothetical protein [Ornithinimicrobium avium]|uniref:hypothetical protein n=1 Tax=Ornithinimicrobium avium TaxID=2283195 RepID=UPI0013B43979|nr:hypothetical protein [Ornithinimicrobium avium]
MDCFTGSGVTGTAARARGLGFAGIEAHPLIAELARLKLTPSATGQAVRDLAACIEASAGRAIASAPNGWQRVLAEEPDLVRRSFAAETLYALVSLRQAIVSHADDPAAEYLKWALLATLRDVAGVKVGWPYQRPGVARKPRHTDAIKRFQVRAQFIATDLDSVASGVAKASSAQVVTGDSRDSAAWAKLSGSGIACVSSPPYLNNFDYADATRLELYFWGEVTTWGDMCREVRGDMVTATTQQSSVREKSEALDVLRGRSARHPDPAEEIVGLAEEMTKAKKERQKRSKEYDQVAPAYFVAMWDILQNLHDFLGAGSRAVWLVGDSAPYGVYIDTPRLIGEMSEAVGFTFTEDVHLRARGDRWRQNVDRHNVKLAERLIVMEKP